MRIKNTGKREVRAAILKQEELHPWSFYHSKHVGSILRDMDVWIDIIQEPFKVLTAKSHS